MTKQEEYRARALECEQEAKKSTDPGIKHGYEELARQWHYLANQAEQLNR